MDKIWYRNLSKSEVIIRYGGDEKTVWPRRTDKNRKQNKTPIRLVCLLTVAEHIAQLPRNYS